MRTSIKIAALLVIWGFVLIKCLENDLITKETFKWHKYSNKTINEIFRDVCKVSGECNKIFKFTIAETPIVNAFATVNQEVIITRGMLDLLKSKDEIALTLGHEIGHIVLRHIYMPEELTSSRAAETQADKYGAMLAILAGYDVCKGKEFMKVLQKENGDNIDSTHPDWSFRYDQLNVNCDK